MYKDKYNQGRSSTAPGKIIGLTGVVVFLLKHQKVAEHSGKTFDQRLI